MSDPQILSPPSPLMRRTTTALFYAVAACLVYVGFRVTLGKTDQDHGRVALYLFAAAAGVVFVREFIYLLPNLVKLKIANVDIQLREEVQTIREEVKELKIDVVEGFGTAGSSAKVEQAVLTKGEE